VVRRKAEVVSAVAGGLLSVDEACERYGLSLEEFASWQRAVDRSGMPGLRVTRISITRHFTSASSATDCRLPPDLRGSSGGTARFLIQGTRSGTALQVPPRQRQTYNTSGTTLPAERLVGIA
jgi:hypothetical protein